MKKGFTLIELTVVISIMSIISVVFFANYQQSGEDFALERSVHKLSQDIRRAQGLALASADFKGEFQGGYGVYFDLDSPLQYVIFTDCNGDGVFNGATLACDDCSSGTCSGYVTEEIETIYLEDGVSISSFTPTGDTFSIKFYPPDPTVTFTPDSSLVSIKLIIGSLSKNVEVNKTGYIGITQD